MLWHPLPVWEIAGSGHLDGAVVGFTALALAAALQGRQAWSGAALAAGFLVKFFPLVIAPALWRPLRSNLGDWRWPAAFIAVVAVAYLPYSGVGWRVLGFLPGYVGEENSASGSGFWLLDIARHAAPIPLAAYLAVAGLVMTGMAIGAFCRRSDRRASLPWAAALGCGALIFASPHYPWYFVWLVALSTAAPWWPACWLTSTAILLYWDANTGRTPIWVGFTIYGGFAILGAVDIARRIFGAAATGADNASKRTT